VGAEGLPEDVEALVAQQFDAMEAVEIMLLLRRTAPQGWTASDVAAELRIDPASAAQRLAHLEQGGLLARARPAEGPSSGGGAGEGGGAAFRYAPRTEALGRSADGLAAAYNERPVTLVRLLYSRPQPPSAVQSFADAFRIRKSDKPGG
jgi:hypothetical protein